MQKADALLCDSLNTAECVRRELNIPSSRVHVVHNIVGPEFRPAAPEERDSIRRELFGEAEFVILHVGKPSHYKNRTGVMEIFKRIKRVHPGCRLAITASPLTAEELAVLADPAVVKDVSVHRLAKREQVRDLYCAADLLVFPSLYEGFGWPPLEAMACDCPVVASPCGSLREVVGEGGMVINDPHDYDAFADAADQILTSDALRRELIAKGRKNTTRFAKNVVFPQLAEVYRQLVN